MLVVGGMGRVRRRWRSSRRGRWKMASIILLLREPGRRRVVIGVGSRLVLPLRRRIAAAATAAAAAVCCCYCCCCCCDSFKTTRPGSWVGLLIPMPNCTGKIASEECETGLSIRPL